MATPKSERARERQHTKGPPTHAEASKTLLQPYLLQREAKPYEGGSHKNNLHLGEGLDEVAVNLDALLGVLNRALIAAVHGVILLLRVRGRQRHMQHVTDVSRLTGCV